MTRKQSFLFCPHLKNTVEKQCLLNYQFLETKLENNVSMFAQFGHQA